MHPDKIVQDYAMEGGRIFPDPKWQCTIRGMLVHVNHKNMKTYLGNEYKEIKIDK